MNKIQKPEEDNQLPTTSKDEVFIFEYIYFVNKEDQYKQLRVCKNYNDQTFTLTILESNKETSSIKLSIEASKSFAKYIINQYL